MSIDLTWQEESWPIAGSFAISRGAKTSAEVIVVTLHEDEHVGRGECVPYSRYDESITSVKMQIGSLAEDIVNGLGREELQKILPAGAARNAIDCALHDLAAKKSGKRIWELLDLGQPDPVVTAYTLSLDTPEKMERAARQSANRPLIKVKLGGEDDAERMKAVRRGAPISEIIVDANEAWMPENLENLLNIAADQNISLIEQPLHAEYDRILAKIEHIVPICADESCHDRQGLQDIAEKYDLINIKIDKTGGLTEALALAEAARNLGLELMVGCMLATSLAMAPSILLGKLARYVDLDGPLLLAQDRAARLKYCRGLVYPPDRKLWG